MLEKIDSMIQEILPARSDNFYYSVGEWHIFEDKQKANVHLKFEDDYGKKAKWNLLCIWDPRDASLDLYFPKDALSDFKIFIRHIGPDGNWNWFDVYDFE